MIYPILYEPFFSGGDNLSTMDDIRDFFEKDHYARENGIELLHVGKGVAAVRMAIREKHLNSHGTVHGGAIFTLADCAFALASNSHGVPAAAINAHISYMKAARSGSLRAEAREFSQNPRLATYTVEVTDDAGEKIAIFQGMAYRKTPPRG
jgi:acyl-CoA thioesterase